MASVNIFSGIYTDSSSDYRTSLPVNFYAIPKDTGISKGYLRPAEGITQLGTGVGADRGAINWNGVCYRVQGANLVSIAADGSATTLGNVGGSGFVTMDYSFTQLIIQSSSSLFYYTPGGGVTQVTDPDLGACISVRWLAGYTVSTDGTSIVVSDLVNTSSFNPLKYGSSESDPDKVVGLERLRNELYVINRHTIEVQQNIGGNGYPFQRVDGAQIMRGSLGSRTYCIFDEKIAFIGGGRNEAIGVYVAVPGQAKISTREIDTVLAGYSESALSACLVESRLFNDQKLLYIHLPDKTLLYDLKASQDAGEHLWTVLSSGAYGTSRYLANNFVYCYGKWLCGDPTSSKYGYLDGSTAKHYGVNVGWEFATQTLFNQTRGALIHRLELISNTGGVVFGADPTIWTSYSFDGRSFSQERPAKAGKFGETDKRIVWLQQGLMRKTRIQKFRGDSDCHMAVSKLEAELEALNV